MRAVVTSIAVAIFLGGCALIVGIEDHTLATTSGTGATSAGGSTTTGATSTGGATTTGSVATGGGGTGGGFPSCTPPDLGVPGCSGGFADCGGDAGCDVVLATDLLHCGACHHDCLGGTCESGVCQEIEISPVHTGGSFGPLAVSGGYVYYAAGVQDANAIHAVPIGDKNAAVALSTTEMGQVWHLAVDAARVYAATFVGGDWKLCSVKTTSTGQTPTCPQTLAARAVGLAITTGGTILVAEEDRIEAIGAQTKTIFTAATDDLIRGMAIDDTHIYWASSPSSGSSLGTIRRATLTGGDVTELASGLGRPEAVAVDGTRVYWADSALGNVSAVPKAGGKAETLAGGLSNPMGIAVSGEDLYFVTYDGLFQLRLCSPMAAPARRWSSAVSAVAVDAEHVFIADTYALQVLGFAP